MIKIDTNGYKWVEGYFQYDSKRFSDYFENDIFRHAANLTWIEGGVINALRGRKVMLGFNKLDTYQMFSVTEVREYDSEHWQFTGRDAFLATTAANRHVRKDDIIG